MALVDLEGRYLQMIKIFTNKQTISIVCLVGTFLPGPPPVMAQFGEIPPGPDQEIIHLAGDVYRFRNLRHYSVFMVTTNGVILGDPISQAGATWLRTELNNRFGAEVKYVIYSHSHPDHASGGSVFADTATFVAHKNTLGYMQIQPDDAPLEGPIRRNDTNRNGTIEPDEATPPLAANFDRLDRNADGSLNGSEIAGLTRLRVHPPGIGYSERMSIELGGKTVELIYPGPNHTDDMTVLYFPEEKVAHTVDYITVGRLPRTMSEWAADVPKAIRTVEELDFEIFSAGHEGTGNKADVTEHPEYIEALLEGVRIGIADGQSLDEVRSSLSLEEYSHLGLFEEYLPGNIEGVFRALTQNQD